MSKKLYVGNLVFKTTNNDLEKLFGDHMSAKVVIEDRETGRSRGFGFVEMSSKEEGEAAIAAFNGKDFNGRNLTLNEAKQREERSGSIRVDRGVRKNPGVRNKTQVHVTSEAGSINIKPVSKKVENDIKLALESVEETLAEIEKDWVEIETLKQQTRTLLKELKNI